MKPLSTQFNIKQILFIIITFLLTLYFPFDSKAQWEIAQSTTNYTGWDQFIDVQFVGKTNAFAVSLNGEQFTSVDGGKTWNLVNSKIGAYIVDFQFYNLNIGYALSAYEKLYKTTDGGITWIEIYDFYLSGYGVYPSNGLMFFTNIDSGYVCLGSYILKTIDAGLSWSLIYTLSNDWAREIYFINQYTGFIGTSSYGVYRTSDGGSTWNLVSGLNGITWENYNGGEFQFINSMEGFATYEDTLYKSLDGGITWAAFFGNPKTGTSDGQAFGEFYFLDNMNGFVAEIGGASSLSSNIDIYRTYDGGISWDTLRFYGDSVIGIYFSSIDTGFIASEHHIYTTCKSGGCGVTHSASGTINSNTNQYAINYLLSDYVNKSLLDSIYINTSVSGGQSPYQYSWTSTTLGLNSTQTSSIIILPTIPSGSNILTLKITDQNGCESSSDYVLYMNEQYVWPGDANFDLISNNYDLLNIGISYSTTGTTRSGASNNWTAQASADWGITFSNGIDYKNADCNGDGTINDDDTLAIYLNYGLTHNKSALITNASAADPDLYLELLNDTANTSDTLKIAIMLGTASIPANNVYGLAFSINYNSAMIDSGSAKIDFSNSWLGDNTNSLSLVKDLHSNGKIDVAFTRKDKQNQSGYGNIGELEAVLEDNISGKDTIYKMINFTISDVKVISYDETNIPVNLIGDSIIIQGLSGVVEEVIQDKVKLYPNPVTNFLMLELPPVETYSISIFNSIGLLVYSGAHASQTTKKNIDVSQLPAGVYMLEVKNKNGAKAIKKVLKF